MRRCVLRFSLLILVAFLPLPASAVIRLAAFALQAGPGVDEKLAAALSDAALAEVRRVPGVEVLSEKELATVLSMDQRKLLLGCEKESCLTRLSGAVDAELVFTGSVAQVGTSWLLHLKLLTLRPNVRVQEADRRSKGGSVDDLLDEIPPAVRELFPQLQGVTSAGLDVTRRKSQAEGPPVSPGAVELPLPEAEANALRPVLRVLTDGAGGYVAFDPSRRSFDPSFWGSKDALHAQRIAGGGSNGDSSFDSIFWEPRVKARWQGGLSMKDGKYELQCGDTAYPLTLLPESEGKALLAHARLLTVRWARHLYALARDEVGTYYLVDQAREPAENTDFRLFVGEKGHMAPVPVTDADVDAGGTLLTTPAGHFQVNFKERKADWIEGRTKTPLVFLDVEENASLAYGKLGAYAGERLGTPCDTRLR
jgi:hypothetical protein